MLDHTADTGIEAWSSSLASLIELLAKGMCRLMAEADPDIPSQSGSFSVVSPTAEDLVVDTLSELLYQSETRDLAFTDIAVRVTDDGLGAEIVTAGVPTAVARVTGPSMKAVTYHLLEVRQDGGDWYGRVFFDV